MTHPLESTLLSASALVAALRSDEKSGLLSRQTLALSDQVAACLATLASLQAGFALGQQVMTIKGAAFRGEITAFDYDVRRPGCEVMATHPDFAGTKHVYPLAQIGIFSFHPPLDGEGRGGVESPAPGDNEVLPK